VSPKIQSKAGQSLADVYDIVGSIAGIDTLETRELPLVHEMGATVFSERLQTNISRMNPGASAQNVTFANTLTMPDGPNRILGLAMVIDTTARITQASLNVATIAGGREIPIWSWDIANDVEQAITFSIDGAAAGTEILLLPGFSRVPYLCTRTSGNVETNAMCTLIFRGLTAGFGAGTVLPLMFVSLARANQRLPAAGQPSAHGLPIPSW